MHGRHRGSRGHRSRRRVGSDDWAVRARIERFHEPALLLMLRERPRHGYELIEQFPDVAGGERVDVGNLYRFLRRLESEGIVASEWNGDLPGPAKRTYSLTPVGRRLLDHWAEALDRLRDDVSAFLDRYAKGGECCTDIDTHTAAAAMSSDVGACPMPPSCSSGWRSTNATSSRRSPTWPI